MSTRKLAPVTVDGHPKIMTSKELKRYLKEKHDIETTERKLATLRAQRRGPKPRYLGNTPTYTREEAARYAEQEAFTDRSPQSLAAERRKAAGLPWGRQARQP